MMMSNTEPVSHGLAYHFKQVWVFVAVLVIGSLLAFPVIFGMACFDLGRCTLACWFNRVDLRSWPPALAYTLFIMVGASVFAFILGASYLYTMVLPEALSKLF